KGRTRSSPYWGLRRPRPCSRASPQWWSSALCRARPEPRRAYAMGQLLAVLIVPPIVGLVTYFVVRLLWERENGANEAHTRNTPRRHPVCGPGRGHYASLAFATPEAEPQGNDVIVDACDATAPRRATCGRVATCHRFSFICRLSSRRG